MSETLNEKTIAELVKLGRMTGNPVTVPGGNTPYAVIPIDCKVVSLGDHIDNDRAARPIRKKGTVKALDAASFCEYYSLFSDEHSRVFADETTSRFLAILDYHGIGDNAARWCQHRVDLILRHSKEFEAWNEQNGKKSNQMDFAEFIEDNTPDIVSPDAATMLEVARGLSAKTDVDFSSAIRMANGSVQFKYNEQVKGTYGAGNLDVPEQFVIAIPIYIGCDRVRLTARLRYRINSGKLTFWFDLLRADCAEREAFLSTRKQIADSLQVSVINAATA